MFGRAPRNPGAPAAKARRLQRASHQGNDSVFRQAGLGLDRIERDRVFPGQSYDFAVGNGTFHTRITPGLAAWFSGAFPGFRFGGDRDHLFPILTGKKGGLAEAAKFHIYKIGLGGEDIAEDKIVNRKCLDLLVRDFDFIIDPDKWAVDLMADRFKRKGLTIGLEGEIAPHIKGKLVLVFLTGIKIGDAPMVLNGMFRIVKIKPMRNLNIARLRIEKNLRDGDVLLVGEARQGS